MGELLTAQLNPEQEADYSVSPVTEGGNPAKIDGEITFAISGGTEGASRIIPKDEKSVTVQVDNVGETVTVTATFDADLGEGTRTVTESIEITCIEAEAVGANENLENVRLRTV